MYINEILEKGGLVFKPVVKSRPCTVPSASRQASVLVPNNTGNSAEYDASPSNSRHAIETSGYATTHSESSIMVDRSNSISIVNPTSSRNLRPPLISSSSNNVIPTPFSLPATENREPLPYDPNGDPGEDIDPTSVTMAALCTDSGRGRVSRKAAEILNNYAAWKAKNKEKRAHMRTLMELKKYGREEAESEHDQDGAQAEGAASTSAPGTSNAPATVPVLDDTGNGFDYSQGLATSRYNVQVRIGPNGETVIDEESLVVDRVENDGTDDYTHVIESDHTKFVNSGTYGKRYRGSRWSAEETERFFDVSLYIYATYMHPT